MKIGEYDNVKCPLCREEKKLVNKGTGRIVAERLVGRDMLCHVVFCQSCSAIFALPYEDQR